MTNKKEFGEQLQKIFHPDDPFPKSEPIEKIIDQYWHKLQVADAIRPSSVLEYGVRGGYSAWSFLTAAPQARYVGVDLYEKRPNDTPAFYRDHALQLLCQFGTRVEIHQEGTERFPLMTDFDLVHADASHDEAGVFAEVSHTFPWVSSRGAMLVDDCGVYPVMDGVRRWLIAIGRRSYLYIDDLRGQVLVPRDERHTEWLLAQLPDCAVLRKL